jgi:tetratricopeptide (TPR) repeat protein
MKKVFIVFFFLVSCGPLLIAQEVCTLLKEGAALIENGNAEKAVPIYEKVLLIDEKNYEALVFLCNYYFLLGQNNLKKLEAVYGGNESPTRMEVAQYQEDLKGVYDNYWSKAEQYLIQAYLIRPNNHLDDMAGQIADFKEMIGLKMPKFKKKSFIRRLLP